MHPRKLGHVVLGSTDHEGSQRFFVDGLGFKVSDSVPGIATFMRCSSDHHNVLVQPAPVAFLHHTSWQVEDVDEVGRGATAMLEADPERHTWGLGRHFIGSNFFWYLRDPAGNFSEYYSDMDCIVDDALWQPGVWDGVKSALHLGTAPAAVVSRARRPCRVDDRESRSRRTLNPIKELRWSTPVPAVPPHRPATRRHQADHRSGSQIAGGTNLRRASHTHADQPSYVRRSLPWTERGASHSRRGCFTCRSDHQLGELGTGRCELCSLRGGKEDSPIDRRAYRHGTQIGKAIRVALRHEHGAQAVAHQGGRE